MHRDSVFKYLLGTNKEFYMDGQAFLYFRGERKIFYTCDLHMHHHMYHSLRDSAAGFTKAESKHIAGYYHYFKINECKAGEAMVWDRERCIWVKVDKDKLFLEYCRSDVQL